MKPLAAVLDSSVIIGLAKGSVFWHLPSLYGRTYVPPAVSEEIIHQGAGRAGAQELADSLGDWIMERAPDPGVMQLFSHLRSQADRQVLAVAHEPGQSISHLLSDDEGLTKRIMRPGLIPFHTADVVVLMKRRGLIPSVREVLDRMQDQDFGIDPALYEQAIRAAGEELI